MATETENINPQIGSDGGGSVAGVEPSRTISSMKTKKLSFSPTASPVVAGTQTIQALSKEIAPMSSSSKAPGHDDENVPWYNRYGEIVSWRNRSSIVTALIMFAFVPNLLAVIRMGADRTDALRMFAVWFGTAAPALVMNHRYFSHSAFKVSRPMRVVCGIIACLGLQYGPVWWSSKHRRHHKKCDLAGDPHSWQQTCFWYAWFGWTMAREEQRIDTEYLHSSLFIEVDVDNVERWRWTKLPNWLTPPEQSTDDNREESVLQDEDTIKEGQQPQQTKEKETRRVIAPELLLVDKFWWVPSVAVQLGLYFVAGVSPRNIFMYYTAPITWVTLPILLFNVMFHPVDNVPLKGGCYALDSLLDPLTFLMGESHHEDHHHFPERAKRPQIIDPSYLLFVKPLLMLGIAWDPKSYGPVRSKATNKQVEVTKAELQ